LEVCELRKAGLKITGPRLKILHILEHSKLSHMTAEDIHRVLVDQGDYIGLATIYRVLTQFEVSGLVIRHNFDGSQSVFELNIGEHHDHMICTETGKIIEFTNNEIEIIQKKIAKEHNYELIDHTLVLYVKPNKP